MSKELFNVIVIVLTTFFFTVLFVPVVKKIAIKIGAVAIPNERSSHTINMPQLGGVAIFFGFLLGYILFSNQTTEMNSVLIGSFILIIFGIVDDINPIKARYKLLIQIVAASIVAIYGGLLLKEIGAFGYYISFNDFSYPLTIFFIVAMINVINLIDGLDGLSAGISSIYFLTIGIIAFINNSLGGLDIVLAFIMLGATLGFLYHNFYPAKIFMGDAGSAFMGFMIAIIALLGFKNVTLTSFIIPVLILAVPILDTLFAIIRRIISKKSIGQADKEHLHHQLMKMKFSHRNTVLIIYLIEILFSITSVIYVLNNAQLGIVLYIILAGLVIWIVIKTNIIFDRSKKSKK